MNLWGKCFVAAMAVWLFSTVGLVLYANRAPDSLPTYIFGTLFALSIPVALVFLFLLMRNLLSDE